MDRVITYVDGFNLYFGLKQKAWSKYYWLNIQELAKNFLRPGQVLVYTKYFTSRVKDNPGKAKRQNNFIEALETLPDFEIFYGKYQKNFFECRRCGEKNPSPNEKMTDVNIAVELLCDAYEDNYDTAILISGDSDLIPPINTVHKLFKNKRIVVAFPPERHNRSMELAAKGSFIIGRKKLQDSLFLDEIIKPDGFILKKPDSWK